VTKTVPFARWDRFTTSINCDSSKNNLNATAYEATAAAVPAHSTRNSISSAVAFQ
jgi:hypothetical protein